MIQKQVSKSAKTYENKTKMKELTLTLAKTSDNIMSMLFQTNIVSHF